jgi:hypothetical protein
MLLDILTRDETDRGIAALDAALEIADRQTEA